jgi:hypothetical protein
VAEPHGRREVKQAHIERARPHTRRPAVGAETNMEHGEAVMGLTNDDLKQAGVTRAGLKGLCAKMDDENFKEYFAGSEHLKYWLLGDFIYEQAPYVPEGMLELDPQKFKKSELELEPRKPGVQQRPSPKIQVRGRLKSNSVDNPFCKKDRATGKVVPMVAPVIPFPPEKGGPKDPPITYYWQAGVNTGEESFDSSGAERKRRNVVKEIEIEYAPPIHEDGKDKPPHIIILYAGGDN